MKQISNLEISMHLIMQTDIMEMIRDNDYYRGFGVTLHTRFNNELYVYQSL